MLTAAQHERLPATARAIVDADRSIAAIVSQPVVSIDVARKGNALAELIRERRALTSAADAVWGRPLRGDGAART